MWVGTGEVPMAVTAEKEFDLSFLSSEETQSVLKVLERDRRLRMVEAERVGRMFPVRDVGLGMKRASLQRTQAVWSTSLPLPLPPVEANPPPLNDSPSPNTQAHTESRAGKDGDLSAGVRRQPTLRSRISSLLSIKFLQRSSRHREASNSSRNTPINIIDMNISNSNTDMGNSRYSDTSKSSRDMDISSRNRDMDISSRNRDMDISSRNRDMDISSRNRDMDISNRNRDMDISSRNRDMDISSRNRDMDISSRNRDMDISSRNRDMDISSISSRNKDMDISSISSRNKDMDISSKNRDMDISSSSKDMDSLSRNRDMDISSRNINMDISSSSSSSRKASSNSSSNRPLQVNNHGVSTEKTRMMWKQNENEEQTEQADKQRGLSLQTIPLKVETPTDQHHRQFPELSSPASLQTQTEASPAETGEGPEPALPSEGMSSKPSSGQDIHKMELSIQHGTVSKSAGWLSEQQSIVGHKTTTDQLQRKASVFYNTELRDKDRSMSDTRIPGPGEKESVLPNGTTIEESRNSTKDGPNTSDGNKDSREPILSIPLYKTHACCAPLRSENNDKRDVIKHTPGGAETENTTHHFSNKNKLTNTFGLSPIWVKTEHSDSEIHCDDQLKTQESVSTRQEAPVAAPKSPDQNDINKLFTERSAFRASNKQVMSTASQLSKTVQTSLDLPKRANGFATDIPLGTDPVGSVRATSASHSQRIMAWRSHLSSRHSSSVQVHSPLPRNQGPATDHQHAVSRLSSYPAAVGSLGSPKARYYPAGTPLVKAKSCERLLQKAASVDSPFSLPVSNMRSMSSSERINILAKHHAQGLKPARDYCDLNEPQLPQSLTRGRCYSIHEINSLQHSQIPLPSSGADNSQLVHTLPKYGLSKDRYRHQTKFSVFSNDRLGQSQPALDEGGIGGYNQQYSKFRSYSNLYKGHSLDKVNINADPVPNKKKRNYSSDMYQADHFNRQSNLSPSYCKRKENRRWSSVSELRNPKGHYRTQMHRTSLSQQQTFPKPNKLLLDSTGSQISLDCSSGSTDDDIFSISPGRCRQWGPLNYFTAHDKGLKPHHKSSSNLYQSTGGRTNVYSSSFDLSHGRSVSVSNVSSNRTAGLRRISTGSRSTTLSDLRDCEDFDDAISPKPRTLSYTLDQTVSSGPVQRPPTLGHIWRGGSLASSSGSLLSPSQVPLDSPFPSANYYLTYVETEDSDSDTLSEGEYCLYGSGEDLESSL